MIAWSYNWGTQFLIGVFAAIDHIVFSLVSLVLTGLYNIGSASIFTNGAMNDFTNRIYVILGIFMLFKLAFSLLNGIVNPDKLDDKQAGMQKIIVRVITSLFLLLLLPTLFEFAYRVQGNLVKVLPQLILGPNQAYKDTSVGENIATTVFKAFITPNPDCADVAADELPDFANLFDATDTVSEQCSSSLSGNKEFRYNYTFLISTVVGAVMIILLILCSIDVAIRLIKMSILQIIAPIPVISYIDPKSSKDGAFSAWTKECISTYISLFIQLGVIFFMVYIISAITEDIGNSLNSGTVTFIDFGSATTTGAKLWVFIFIIIGGFYFMRQAPKYLMKVLGIKDGIGLGIGLNAGMAGLGSVLSGGGLLGTGAAMYSALNEGAKANAEGKSAFTTNGYNKGKELGTQIKYGNPEVKPLTASDKLMNRAMRKSLDKKGINDATLENAEANIDDLKTEVSGRETHLGNIKQLQQLLVKENSNNEQLAMYQAMASNAQVHAQEQENIANDVSRSAQERANAKSAAESFRTSYNDAISNANRIQVENNSIASQVSTTVSKIRSTPGNQNFNVPANPADLDDNITIINKEISNRREVISEAQSKYSEVKSKYKAVKSSSKVKGKPTQDFAADGKIGGSLGTIDREDKNKL